VRKFAKAEQVVDGARDYVAVLDTVVGNIVLDLFEKDAPVTTNSFVFLSLNHFYEDTLFHRVIEGFMAQGGDPSSVAGKPSTWGTGGCGYTFGLEVKANLSFDAAGVLGQARAATPDSNGSQFFITLVARKDLDQKYTVWGKVIEGLDVLPKIPRGEPPAAPAKVIEVRIGVK
jgi:peptidylprolyl isomerase